MTASMAQPVCCCPGHTMPVVLPKQWQVPSRLARIVDEGEQRLEALA